MTHRRHGSLWCVQMSGPLEALCITKTALSHAGPYLCESHAFPSSCVNCLVGNRIRNLVLFPASMQNAHLHAALAKPGEAQVISHAEAVNSLISVPPHEL